MGRGEGWRERRGTEGGEVVGRGEERERTRERGKEGGEGRKEGGKEGGRERRNKQTGEAFMFTVSHSLHTDNWGG